MSIFVDDPIQFINLFMKVQLPKHENTFFIAGVE